MAKQDTLPVERSLFNKQPYQDILLSDIALHYLPVVLEKLIQQEKQWTAIMKNNNVRQIREFSECLLQLGEKYLIQALQGYATQLLESIETFDTEGIKQRLKHFLIIHQQLRDKFGQTLN